MRKHSSLSISLKLWFASVMAFSAGAIVFIISYSLLSPSHEDESFFFIFLIPFAAILFSIPALLLLFVSITIIHATCSLLMYKINLLITCLAIISLLYGSTTGFVIEDPSYNSLNNFLEAVIIAAAILFTSSFIGYRLCRKQVIIFFTSSIKKIHTMENSNLQQTKINNEHSNKLWIKGLVTAGLILVMLIPTVFIMNLVEERQQRQQEVKQEVSSKWAGAQTITFPYLTVPYTVITNQQNGKQLVQQKSFYILPENLNVSGSVVTEKRQRSIYTVLLYNSAMNADGNFEIRLPADISDSSVNWKGVKMCVGISDFKGIEEGISASIDNRNYAFEAGLPDNSIDTSGLSSSVNISDIYAGKSLPFKLKLKIKGSDNLHFIPLAGNSRFALKSNWNSPSFDGNTLPSERSLNNAGFEAVWNFNKANLPFNTVLKNIAFNKNDFAFGATFLQLADQYAKTIRCVKYAILFIGLTFSMVFIMEIMQKKPFHPVQYVLVGLALIIFYTLLLSISEFLLFFIAYVISAAATIILITFYTKSHFKSWKTAGTFAIVISIIYSFIYILISLEDTALLVGSIGLFVILALVMYASRKINWYGTSLGNSISQY